MRTHAAYVERTKGVRAVKDIEPKIKHTLVMRELPKPRDAYVHLGGDFLRKGVSVKPGTLAVLPPMPRKEDYTRLDFARWLVDAKNPLTPRVTMNRVWQRYFGKASSRPRTTSARKAHRPRTRDCSIGWRRSSSRATGA